MRVPLYEALAKEVDRYQRCVKDPTFAEAADSALENIKRLCQELPSGSGFDNGTQLELEKCTTTRLVFTTAFHHMDENGYYDGWTEHTVVCKADLAFNFNLWITGRNRNDIREFMAETFQFILSQSVELYPEVK